MVDDVIYSLAEYISDNYEMDLVDEDPLDIDRIVGIIKQYLVANTTILSD